MFISLLILLSACSNNIDMNEDNSENSPSEFPLKKVNLDATSKNTVSLPSEMPNDFNFSINFGVEGKNSINTFNDTIQKDLVTDGIVTTRLQLTKNEMTMIYNKMREINIFELKALEPSKLDCLQTPFETDKWTIIVDGKIANIEWSNQHCVVTNDAKKLLNLRQTVFELAKSKKEYQKLPKVKGGYS